MKKYLFIIIPVFIVLSLFFTIYLSNKNRNIDIEIGQENTFVQNENINESLDTKEEVIEEAVEQNAEVKKEQVESDEKVQEKIEKSSNTNKSENTYPKTTTNSKTSSVTKSSKIEENKPIEVEKQEQSNIEEQQKSEQPKIQEETTSNVNKECTHYPSAGNSGKWFNTKNEAIAEYNSKISYWGNLWEKFEIDDATYYKNCPNGYELWSCIYCSKWTINYYFR